MPRLSLPRRTLAGGTAVVATASLVIAGLATSAAASPVATPHFLSAHFTATDTAFTVGQISPVLDYGNGTHVAYVDLHNPSAYLPLKVSSTFYASEFNAAGAQIGTIESSGVAGVSNPVPPGADVLVQLKMTVPGVISVTVPNPAGANSDDLSDRLNVVGAPSVVPPSYPGGSYAITGSVSNPSAVPQSGRVTVEIFGAAGQLIDSIYTYTDGTSIPAGGATTFSAYYSPVAGAPAPASYQYYVDGTPVDSAASYFSSYIPVSSAPVAGKSITVKPKLLGGDTFSGIAGKTIALFARTPGSAPKQLASGVTGSDGVASIKVTIPPAVEIYFVYAGDGSRFGSSTGDLYYMVAPSLGLSGPKASVHPKSKIQLTGSFPFYPGEKAVLQELIGKHWVKVNNGGAGSKFVMHVKAPSKKGRYSFRLQVNSNPFHSSATSKVFTLTVK